MGDTSVESSREMSSRSNKGRGPGALVWHYTSERSFRLIVESGVILPTEIMLDVGERPAAWFSSNQWWEATALKGGAKTMRQTAERFGLYRFGIVRTPTILTWSRFRLVSGISVETAKSLVRAGKSVGAAPHAWFVSFEPVPSREWVAVEKWETGRWTAAEVANPYRVVASLERSA